jgi:dTMP kinase
VTARWIAFEGGEGCGKSTQARLLAERLDAVLTREPGGTAIGERVRAILLDATDVRMHERTEALLMAADRAEHVAEVVRPALDAGRHVVSDRSVWSSIAYQGGGRGLDPDALLQINRWATSELFPDVVVLIDVTPAVARTRTGAPRDRLEAAGEDFHGRVAAAFAELARQHGWVVVDGDASVEAVAEQVWAAVGSQV